MEKETGKGGGEGGGEEEGGCGKVWVWGRLWTRADSCCGTVLRKEKPDHD